jgi:hypothetical protein
VVIELLAMIKVESPIPAESTRIERLVDTRWQIHGDPVHPDLQRDHAARGEVLIA